jgi:D-aspartate ligase
MQTLGASVNAAGPMLESSTFKGLSEILARRDRPESHWPSAVVASVFQTGLNLMRDLEQKGVRVVGVDCNPDNPGFRSKYGRSFLCPNPDTEPDNWLAFMLSLAAAMGEKPVLIPAADIYVSAIGRHAQILSEHFIFSEKGSMLQAALATKETQYDLAQRYGLPSPRADYVQSVEELEQFCQLARFPVLLKPRHAREWQALPEGNPLRGSKTVSSRSREELISHYGQVSAWVPQAVVQEEIVGPDSAKYCYLSVYATDGHRLGSCVVQELRAYPLLYGCATLVEPVVDEEIDSVCNKFLLSLGYVGICEIELKRDTRDGRLLLIEVNPRFSGTGDSAKHTGVETGFLHYLDLIGRTPQPVVATRFGFRHVMLVADLAAFPKYLEEGQISWAEWIRSYCCSMKYFDFDLKDFTNARMTAVKGARELLGGLRRTWRRQKSSVVVRE